MPRKKFSFAKLPPGPQTKVVGGLPVEEGRFDYAAAIFSGDFYFCTGGLITPSAVLTSASCVDGADITSVLLQCTDIVSREGCEEINVAQTILQPDFFFGLLPSNDTAVLILESPSTAATVSLPGANFVVPEETQVTTIGWGATDFSGENPSDVLLEADLDTVNSQFCDDQYRTIASLILRDPYYDYYGNGSYYYYGNGSYYYDYYGNGSYYDYYDYYDYYGGNFSLDNITLIDDTLICAMGDEKGACFEDAGGPLLLKCDATGEDVAVATFSGSVGCAYEGIPGVFGRTFTPQAFEFIISTVFDATGEVPNVVESLDDFCLVGGTKAPTDAGEAPTPFPTFSEDIIDLWICNSNNYATQDGCHCNCGIPDPDCISDIAEVIGCDGFPCNADGTCNFLNETDAPTFSPTLAPTSSPTLSPTLAPTSSPTSSPTLAPSTSPTSSPTLAPSTSPTLAPTSSPTLSPTLAPTLSPTLAPTLSPTLSPTNSPTTPAPTSSPTFAPTGSPIVDVGAGEGVVDAGLATFFIIGFVLFSVLSIVLGGWVYMLKKDKSAENAFAEKEILEKKEEVAVKKEDMI